MELVIYFSIVIGFTILIYIVNLFNKKPMETEYSTLGCSEQKEFITNNTYDEVTIQDIEFANLHDYDVIFDGDTKTVKYETKCECCGKTLSLSSILCFCKLCKVCDECRVDNVKDGYYFG